MTFKTIIKPVKRLNATTARTFTIWNSPLPDIKFYINTTVEMLPISMKGMKPYNKNSPNAYLKTNSQTYFLSFQILENNFDSPPTNVIMRIMPIIKLKFWNELLEMYADFNYGLRD